ncbi:hypothetical protein D3C76_827780 [compost metagenome]
MLDTALAQLRPDLLVFLAHLLVVRVRRPVDADCVQVGQAYGDRPVAAVLQQAHVHLQAGHCRLLHRGGGAWRQRGEALVGLRQLAREEFAFGTVEFQGKVQVVPAFPAIAVEQFHAGSQIGQRRGVGA